MTTEADPAPIFEFGPFRLDPLERLLRRDGRVVPLTPKAFDLLVYLVQRHGRLAEKQALLSALWPDTIVEEANLPFQISALRKALDDGAGGDSFIQTVPTRGYRFTASVVAVPVSSALGNRSTDPIASHSTPLSKSERDPSRRFRLGVIAPISVLLGLGLAGLALWNGLTNARGAAPGGADRPARIGRLTSLTGIESHPAFSPDGEQVAFAWTGLKDGDHGLYVTMVGSSDVRRLTTPASAQDSHPSWSPDGRQLAFLRDDGQGIHVYLVSTIGGSDTRVSDFPARGRIGWLPDGRDVIVGRDSPDDKDRGIYLLSTQRGEARALTRTSAPALHVSPALAPDGRRMAYVNCRFSTEFGASDCELTLVDIDRTLTIRSSAPRLARMPTLGGLAWTRDGQSIIFFGDETGAGTTHLWRLRVDAHRPPERIEAAGTNIRQAATNPRNDRVAVTRIEFDVDVFRFRQGDAAVPVVSSSSDDLAPAYSTDGRQIAFVSSRGGDREVWVSTADGSRPRQLTHGPNHMQSAPRWSPDDRRIAFESQGADGHWHVWVIAADGGQPHQVTSSVGNQNGPTWSRDAGWIYFSADRGHGRDIWRVRSTGGTEEQLSTGGSGYIAFVASDGNGLVYQQTTTDSPLMLMPPQGGQPRVVVKCAAQDAFTANAQGIYYIPCDPNASTVHLVRASTGEDRVVFRLEALDRQLETDLAVSPDGSSILYARRVNHRGDLWLIEDFK